MAFEKFGDEEVRGALRAHVKDGEKIGMVESAEDAGFLFKTRETVGVGGYRLGEDLDGDGALEAGVAREIDFTLTAGAQGRDDFVGTEPGGVGEGHASGIITANEDDDECGQGFARIIGAGTGTREYRGFWRRPAGK